MLTLGENVSNVNTYHSLGAFKLLARTNNTRSFENGVYKVNVTISKHIIHKLYNSRKLYKHACEVYKVTMTAVISDKFNPQKNCMK